MLKSGMSQGFWKNESARLWPVILGSIFVTMLSNAMNLLEVGGYVQQILLGCVIIAAIFLDRIRQTRG